MKVFSAVPVVLFGFLSSLLTLSAQPQKAASAQLVLQESGDALAAFSRSALVDQNGAAVTEDRLHGKLVLLNFIFTHCETSCPLQTEELAAVQRALPPELRSKISFVSVSVDPENDTPSALVRYASEHKIDPRHWIFVTGSPEQVGQLNRSFDAFNPAGSKPGAGFHTTDVRLFDGRGRFIQRYAGVPVDKPRLVREIEALASESGSAGF